MNLKDLAKPFNPDDIEWRISRSGVRDGKPWGKVLAYVTARAIFNRLDEVCGIENWENQYKPAPLGGVLCGISVYIDDRWVLKWDGSDNTNIEAIKGGLSSAMKRAGSVWGIGRYLYNLDEGWADFNDNGKYNAKIKGNDGKEHWYKWNPPQLPSWALPEGFKSEPKKPEPKQEKPFDKNVAIKYIDNLMREFNFTDEQAIAIQKKYTGAKTREDFRVIQKEVEGK